MTRQIPDEERTIYSGSAADNTWSPDYTLAHNTQTHGHGHAHTHLQLSNIERRLVL